MKKARIYFSLEEFSRREPLVSVDILLCISIFVSLSFFMQDSRLLSVISTMAQPVLSFLSPAFGEKLGFLLNEENQCIYKILCGFAVVSLGWFSFKNGILKRFSFLALMPFIFLLGNLSINTIGKVNGESPIKYLIKSFSQLIIGYPLEMFSSMIGKPPSNAIVIIIAIVVISFGFGFIVRKIICRNRKLCPNP